MTHPGGIMSMNAGMLEAANLVEHLSTDNSDEVRQFRLAAYNADCLGEWKRRLDLDHQIIASDATASWLLNHDDVCWATSLPPAKRSRKYSSSYTSPKPPDGY